MSLTALRPAAATEAALPGALGNRPVVLIVDDTPDNLALLSDTLRADGYAVLVALSGDDALKCLARVTPDVVLLDAMMPGLDGFETCRRLKLEPRHEHLPVIFMTALAESEHVVQGFRVGGIDYVTKPVRPEEVCARIASHVQRSRAQRYADAVLGLEARAAVIVDGGGAIRWQSPQAAVRLAGYGDDADRSISLASDEPAATPLARAALPARLRQWFVQWREQGCPEDAVHETIDGGVRRSARVTGAPTQGEWVVVLEASDDGALVVTLLDRFGLTTREAEVLLWVSRGKTNRDIGDILDMAPRTVNKHLEHLFRKLHVETRSAAAALAVKAVGRG
ncbi:transcriptional regulator, LuxR family [Burkholderia plantarii]|uniref:Transcriptional regulator, LuxR family n=1 Tax=Burkholderia plantarii TaxID=41899 RepID=A0A0B6RY00_BURPL|nr:response regulator [Burkholderia plantarii]AJK47049.1 transcriptional regulator, LuxR family [Burkholderia plantarii]